MRIIVCIKQICHVYARSGMAPGEHFLAPEDRIYRINPYDEAAVELALRAREQRGEGEVVLLTLGPLIAEGELRRCLALGADSLYRIDCDEPMDPWRKSLLLARAAADLKADLVLCGKESMDRRSGQVGAFVAHHLGLPFLSAVSRLSVLADGRDVEAERKAGRGEAQTLRCALPAAMSVELGVELRLPASTARRWSRSAAIENLRFEDEGDGPGVVVRRVFPPRPRPKPVAAPDSRQESFERIQQLLAGSRTRKKGVLLEGSCEAQVEEILSFMVQHGFLEPQVE